MNRIETGDGMEGRERGRKLSGDEKKKGDKR